MNEKLLDEAKAGGYGIAEKIITVERIVTKMIPKEVDVDKIVTQIDPTKKYKVTEELRKKLKADIRLEFKDHIKELEANVMAY